MFMAFLVGYTQQLPCLFLLDVSTNVKPFWDNRLTRGTGKDPGRGRVRLETILPGLHHKEPQRCPFLHKGALETAPSVAAAASRGRPECSRTLVTQEVVAREDVVDLQAVGAGKALAYIALEQAFPVNQLGSATVVEEPRRGGAATRLTGGRGVFHRPRFQGSEPATAYHTRVGS